MAERLTIKGFVLCRWLDGGDNSSGKNAWFYSLSNYDNFFTKLFLNVQDSMKLELESWIYFEGIEAWGNLIARNFNSGQIGFAWGVINEGVHWTCISFQTRQTVKEKYIIKPRSLLYIVHFCQVLSAVEIKLGFANYFYVSVDQLSRAFFVPGESQMASVRLQNIFTPHGPANPAVKSLWNVHFY